MPSLSWTCFGIQNLRSFLSLFCLSFQLGLHVQVGQDVSAIKTGMDQHKVRYTFRFSDVAACLSCSCKGKSILSWLKLKRFDLYAIQSSFSRHDDEFPVALAQS